VLKKCSAADLSVINGIVPSATAEAAVSLVGDGTYLYTLDFSGGTGKARVRKFDSGLNLLASSADFPLAADGSGNSQRLVLCAGSLWAGLVYSSIVRRINPATLATVTDISVTAASDVATDGTYVYVRQNQSAHIAKIDPASNTVTATFTVDQDLTFSYLACAGGHLFTQKLDGTLRATNTSDGSNASHALGKPGAAPSAGDGHVAFTDDVTRTVTIVDATTLAAYGSFAHPASARRPAVHLHRVAPDARPGHRRARQRHVRRRVRPRRARRWHARRRVPAFIHGGPGVRRNQDALTWPTPPAPSNRSPPAAAPTHASTRTSTRPVPRCCSGATRAPPRA
jgi:DNA-binding beta-propeller fold protein YncE